ncbi:hypothetical protein TcWFU_002902 [Taenia crassiceps]|uniref:Uncharacterized protein n=1 Tax=Taenia crassiceps TaxID=6207 RepID=A0ABR4QKE3_9CEST
MHKTRTPLQNSKFGGDEIGRIISRLHRSVRNRPLQMDPDLEIEDMNGYGAPQPPASRGLRMGSFTKSSSPLPFFTLYFLLTRFSAAFGARVARLVTGDQERNYDEEMREARRRLQERFDNERKSRKAQIAEDSSVKATEKPKDAERPQNASKRIKPPNPDLINSSGYFPLMGDGSGSSVCFRRSRKPGG